MGQNMEEEIINLATISTLNIEGVCNLSGNMTESLSKNLLGIDLTGKGVKLYKSDKGMTMDIYIIAAYGFKIPQLAWEIQKKVKEAVEETFQVTLNEINIHVQGVSFLGE